LDVQRDFSIPPELLKDSPYYEILVKQRTTQSDMQTNALCKRAKPLVASSALTLHITARVAGE
jgi:hypothetical protein